MRWVKLEPIMQSEVRPHSFYSWEFSGRCLDRGADSRRQGAAGSLVPGAQRLHPQPKSALGAQDQLWLPERLVTRQEAEVQ